MTPYAIGRDLKHLMRPAPSVWQQMRAAFRRTPRKSLEELTGEQKTIVMSITQTMRGLR